MGNLEKTEKGYIFKGGFNTANVNDMKQLVNEGTRLFKERFEATFKGKKPKEEKKDKEVKKEKKVLVPDRTWKKDVIVRWINAKLKKLGRDEEIVESLSKMEMLEFVKELI